MSRGKGIAAGVVIALLLCATLGWSADQDRDQLRDQDQMQLRDGSCEDNPAVRLLSAPNGNGDCDRLRDGTGDGVPDQDRDRDQDRDGSCLT